jgi:hypothetical protein
VAHAAWCNTGNDEYAQRQDPAGKVTHEAQTTTGKGQHLISFHS